MGNACNLNCNLNMFQDLIVCKQRSYLLGEQFNFLAYGSDKHFVWYFVYKCRPKGFEKNLSQIYGMIESNVLQKSNFSLEWNSFSSPRLYFTIAGSFIFSQSLDFHYMYLNRYLPHSSPNKNNRIKSFYADFEQTLSH